MHESVALEKLNYLMFAELPAIMAHHKNLSQRWFGPLPRQESAGYILSLWKCLYADPIGS